MIFDAVSFFKIPTALLIEIEELGSKVQLDQLYLL